jgi:hypothetical protein
MKTTMIFQNSLISGRSGGYGGIQYNDKNVTVMKKKKKKKKRAGKNRILKGKDKR